MEMGAELDPLDACARCTHDTQAETAAREGQQRRAGTSCSQVRAGPLEVSSATGIELFWSIFIANAQKQS